MEKSGVNVGILTLIVVAFAMVSLVLFSEGINFIGYSVLDSDGGGSDLPSPTLDLGVEGIKTALVPGVEKSLTVSVQNNDNEMVSECKLLCEGSAYCESSLVTDIDSGEVVDFPFVISIVDEIPDVWVECLEGRKNVDVNFVLYKPDLSAEILNVNFDGDKLIVNSIIYTDVNSEEVLTFRVTDDYGNVIQSVRRDVIGKENSSVEETITIDLGDVSDGLLNVGVLKGDNILVEDTVIYGRSSVEVEESNLLNMFGEGTYIYIIVLVVVFLLVASMYVVRIYWNLQGRPSRKK